MKINKKDGIKGRIKRINDMRKGTKEDTMKGGQKVKKEGRT